MQALSRTSFMALAAVLLLSACGQGAAPPAPSSPPPVAAVPTDPKLAKLYDQTCKACHATGAGGAPISGDTAAWTPRAAQGLATLLDHTVNGYKGMPPLGSCSDCSTEEFEALIRFMAGMDAGS